MHLRAKSGWGGGCCFLFPSSIRTVYDVVAEGLNVLWEESPPRSLYVCLQGEESLSWPQQSDESIVQVSEVLDNLPGLGAVKLVGQGAQCGWCCELIAPPCGEPTYHACCCSQTSWGQLKVKLGWNCPLSRPGGVSFIQHGSRVKTSNGWVECKPIEMWGFLSYLIRAVVKRSKRIK